MAAMSGETAQGRPLVEWFALTIECPDAEALAAFYAEALGGEITRRKEDCVLMRAPGLAMNFHSAPDYTPTTWPSWEVPMHHHFELVVDDPEQAARVLVERGATMVEHPDPDDPHYLILRDPAGNPFCLIRSNVARRP